MTSRIRRIGGLIAMSLALAGSLSVTDAEAGKARKKGPPRIRKMEVFADSAIRRVEVPGAELAYVSLGKGEPIVLLHPTALDMRAWLGQMEPLSRGYRVIAYSRRYHYPNPAPRTTADESMAAHVRDLTALIRALDLGKVHLVGHSEGATIAAMFAFEHPELVRSLVLADPSLPELMAETGHDSAFVVQRRQALTLAYMALRDGFDRLGVERWVDWEYGDGAILLIPRPIVQQLADNAGMLRRKLASPQLGTTMGCGEIRKIRPSMLIVDADGSPWYAHEVCDAVAKCRPETRRVTLKSASHGMPWSRPNDFNRTITDFLGRTTVAHHD